MDRRHFLASGLATGLAASSSFAREESRASASSASAEFKLNYAPHFGMFRYHAGSDPIDELKFMADEGFAAMEDNGMMGHPVELQEKISREMSRLNMIMGVFVAYSGFGQEDLVTNTSKNFQAGLVKQMKAAIEVATRVNARWCTVVPAQINLGLEMDYQMANVIENLKVMAGACEPAGLVMVLEPLNWFANHPGLFLTKIPQAYQICKAVNSPSCKILNDLYHQQVSEGNLIANIDMAWDEIAYFQVGDNPGRCEPTTGEINYQNVFKHIYDKGFKGVVGMEHGNSRPGKEGERAVIEAYRHCDDF
jgi:hydroxypyruvate isomerase